MKEIEMPVKPPSKISLAWWKKNYPASMPTNKEVEALLKRAEDLPPSKAGPKLIALIMDEKSKNLDPDLSKVAADYAGLLEALKRSKALVTKAKHDDFVAAIDVLINLVRKDKDTMAAISKKALADKAARNEKAAAEKFKAGDINASDGNVIDKHTAKLIANFDKSLSTKPKIVAAALKKIAASGTSATDAETLAVAIGRNRFVQKEVKKFRNDAKELADALKKSTAQAQMEMRLRAVGLANDLGKLTDQARTIDKALVAKAIAVLGDEKGKKLFMKAPEKPVKL